MTIVRAHIEWLIDPDEPENNIVNVPHFNVGAVIPGDDPAWGELAQEIAESTKAWQSVSAVPHAIRVKVYDAEAPAPNYPKADYQVQDAPHTLNQWPHELALCLSYYAVHNVPRRRGRLYLCPGLMFNSQGLGEFASDVQIQKMMDYGPVLESIGGINVDWCVWSRVDRQAHAVTDYWVDNEWDVQRRRGLKALKRLTATTDEDSRTAAREATGGFRPLRTPRARTS